VSATACASKTGARIVIDTVAAIRAPLNSWARIATSTYTKDNLMNSIVYIVGAIVIIVAILSFFGLR
jgi:hypothetical protein